MQVQAKKKVCAMQVTETPSEGLKREYKVVVPAAELDAKVNARLDELKARVRINGFRPGKVPVTHLKRMYGRATMAEVIESKVVDRKLSSVSCSNAKALAAVSAPGLIARDTWCCPEMSSRWLLMRSIRSVT